jgi:tripartite-type tricarboxylate transporter receptor subunit TctC
MKRKPIVLMSVFVLAIVAIAASPCLAKEEFPTQPISLYVGFPPGGVAGNSARAISIGTSRALGERVLVLNKPGAGGTIAADFLIHAKPDGYTLLNATTTTIAYSMFTKGVSWGPKDFTIILGYTSPNFALVTPADAPWKNFDEWVEYVRKHPGFIFGDYGDLGTMHIMMEWLSKKLNLKLKALHFKGDAPGITAVLGKQIQVYASSGSHVVQVKAGKLRTLLQVSGEAKDKDTKNVTSFKARFPDGPIEVFDLPFGIFGPKGMPDDIRAKLTTAFKKGAESEECVRALSQMNMSVKIVEPDTLEKELISAHEKLGKLIEELGLKR